MKIKIDIIDAFTDTRFSGNSAAVVITDTWLDDDLMQSIASENNLSETAFLVKHDEQYHIRWFSVLTEIDFCGHATLAASYVIFSSFPERTSISLYAKAVGNMVIEKSPDGRIKMDFPNRMPQRLETVPEQLLLGLSIRPTNVLKSAQAYFAIYDNEEDVLAVTQDKTQLMQLGPLDVVVTALSHGKYDFISRYFWPANGGDEDPVTGSIHTGLAPYWAQQLGKTSLVAYQASKRGGVLYCEVEGERVFISGYAVKYLEGIIEV
ncbi:PhzF family phenazine biosynthesis protein [Pseudoalteromonas sp. S16_S37]|uniref:PhzF family phenazine biosynthesis protein n=1 Tax=Pseudoalteromonas sp. S16_S37 TaxID=2720228 RepID=UPI0016810D92|nr:PhzF family phenazine biosynthesis protein [Pseudoalteromonas sp. S16_S37]MBD1583373.1 PhzF family phenazine biosynthesis protein [Pseudoalteromonas sp. S16_S37]